MPVVKKKVTKTDPELLRQMKSAAKHDQSVVGVFRIMPEDSTKLLNSPERTEELAQRVLERVRKRVGYGANRFNVLRNVGVVVVSARPPFLDELRHEPEIASAIANEQPGSAVIAPINKRPAPPVVARKAGVTKKAQARAGRSGAARRGAGK